jgi:hypothetical protein
MTPRNFRQILHTVTPLSPESIGAYRLTHL